MKTIFYMILVMLMCYALNYVGLGIVPQMVAKVLNLGIDLVAKVLHIIVSSIVK